MTELSKEESGRPRWLKGLAAAGWSFSVIMGVAGLGLMGGMAYGAWVASQTPRTSPNDTFFVAIAWLICLPLYGAIGFVGGLAVGLLVMAVKWIAKLARRIAGGVER
jgi:hypothetical protein